MKKTRIILAGAAAGFLLILSGCGKTTIKVSDYVNVKFDGLDGKGTAMVTTDGLEGAVERAVYGKNKAGALEGIDMAFEVMDAVTFTLDNSTDLKNGDSVTVNIEVDEDTAQENNIKFTGTEPMQFTVSGLDEPVMIDPFDPAFFNNGKEDGVNINITGASPEAEVRVKNNLPDSEPASKIIYSVDEEKIAKGQEITIKASAGYGLEEMGYMLSAEETKYKCDDVDVYLSSLDEISDEKMNWLIEESRKLAEGRDEQNNGLGLNLKSGDLELNAGRFSNLKFTKAYFLTPKEAFETYSDVEEIGDYWGGNARMNKSGLILCYTCDVKDHKNVYGCCFASDIVVKPNGDYEFDAVGLKANNLLYETEDYFKTKFIDPHLEKYNGTEKNL